MEIVILDSATLGNDLNLNQLSTFGTLTSYDYTYPNQTIERIKNAQIIITNKVIIGEKELQNAPNLKLICVAATGYNNIDTKAAYKRKIPVLNVKGYSTNSVAQHLFAYLLNFYNSVEKFLYYSKQNLWQKSKIFTSLDYQVEELSGKTMGIIGYGAIGRRVAEIAKVFGLNILIAKVPGRQYEDNFHIPLNQVLQNSDIITIHTPLTNLTHNLLSFNEFNLVNKNAIIINLARGGIIDEQALFEALINEKIKGAIVDVLTLEPPRKGNILFNAPNIQITPHIAWTSKQARQKLLQGIIDNIQAFLNGKAFDLAVNF